MHKHISESDHIKTYLDYLMSASLQTRMSDVEQMLCKEIHCEYMICAQGSSSQCSWNIQFLQHST